MTNLDGVFSDYVLNIDAHIEIATSFPGNVIKNPKQFSSKNWDKEFWESIEK